MTILSETLEKDIQAMKTTFAKDRVFEVVTDWIPSWKSLGPGQVSLVSPFFHRIERPKTPHLRRRRKKMTLNTRPDRLPRITLWLIIQETRN